jgi:Mlc titration factor MtfA (ptsG expression regulator)
MAGGEADGVPPLPDRATRDHWTLVMTNHHRALCQALEAGVDTWLDPYAASGLEEFFPVAAEAFFVAPLGLREHHGEVYHLLADYFGQDPARHAR